MMPMNNPKVSVLVPVYGVANFIERCARSLFSQTMLDDIEYIFVNDGTPDRSMEILDKVIADFPHRRHQIRIINHERNRGLAAARVTAVLAAKGDYVAHCDSDDWVEPNMYAAMYNAAIRDNADIVICDFIEEKAVGSHVVEQHLLRPSGKTVESVFLYELAAESLSPFLWNRMIRRSFYIDNRFFADERIGFCEDLAVTIPMHLCTEQVTLIHEPLYHYNMMNSGSMTREKSLKKIESCALAKENIRQFLIDKSAEELLPALDLRWFFYYLPLITSIEAYDPRLWLRLVEPDIKVGLKSRTRVSVWLVIHRMFAINKLLNMAVRLLFKR